MYVAMEIEGKLYLNYPRYPFLSGALHPYHLDNSFLILVVSSECFQFYCIFHRISVSRQCESFYHIRTGAALFHIFRKWVSRLKRVKAPK